MPTYREGDSDAIELVHAVMQAYHAPLVDVEVSVFVRFARPTYDEKSGLPKGHAITKGGLRVLADIRINSCPDRIEGKRDVTLTVDEDWWNDAGDAARRAAIDGQFQRIELDLKDEDDTASVQTDNANRPKLKKVPPDWCVAGFDCVVDRHGRDALEVTALADVCKRPVIQRTFRFQESA